MQSLINAVTSTLNQLNDNKVAQLNDRVGVKAWIVNYVLLFHTWLLVIMRLLPKVKYKETVPVCYIVITTVVELI